MMKNFKPFALAAYFIILLLAFAGTALSQQQTPNPPLNLKAVYNGENGVMAVILKWSANPDGPSANVYFIYMAEKETTELSDFKRIDYIKPNQNSQEYSFNVYRLSEGDYSFYVTAGILMNSNYIPESSPSNIVHVKVGNNAKDYIKITSYPNIKAEVGKEWKYEIKAESNVNCPIKFELMQNAPEGMKIDKSTGVLTWTPKKAGYYPVYIKAFLECNNLIATYQQFSIQVGNNSNEGYVKIVSEPPLYGFVGKEWVYQIQATTNLRCIIKYELYGENPSGMTIDQDKGIVRWTPSQNGVYYASVRAYLPNCDEIIEDIQKIMIKVGEGNIEPEPCAILYGTITFEDGTNVKEATIKAWRIDRNNSKNPVYICSTKDASFQLKVPEGTYILEAEGPEFNHIYYIKAETFEKAEKLNVKCKDEIKCNFVVTKKPQPKYFQVEGRVTAKENGNPVMAYIEFVPIEYLNGKKEGWNSPNNIFTTKTDQNGYYSIKLPDIFTYVAHSIPMPNSQDGMKYLDQYYNQVTTPFEADLLYLTQDLNNIDFILSNRIEINNGFTGIVKDENNNGLKAIVIAYLVEARDNKQYKNYNVSVQTNDNGLFNFKNLIPGNYVLLSIPADRKYIPGYYKLGDFVTQIWRDATKIGVGENMIDLVYELKHKIGNGKKGIIVIKGYVNGNGSNLKKGDTPLMTNPISGACVYAIDEYGEVSDFMFTDENGYFELNTIGEGNNRLVIDKVGYDLYESNIQSDYEENYSSNVNVTLTQTITSVEEENIQNSFTIYPLPASDYILIKSPEGFTSLTLYNSIGNVIMTREIDNTFTQIIDIKNYPTGIYILKLSNGNNALSKRFTIIK